MSSHNIYKELVSVYISTSNANIWEGNVTVLCTRTVTALLRCRLHYSLVSSLALPHSCGVFSDLSPYLNFLERFHLTQLSLFENTMCEDEVWQVTQ